MMLQSASKTYLPLKHTLNLLLFFISMIQQPLVLNLLNLHSLLPQIPLLLNIFIPIPPFLLLPLQRRLKLHLLLCLNFEPVFQLLVAAFKVHQLSILCFDDTGVFFELLNFFGDETVVKQCWGGIVGASIGVVITIVVILVVI